MSKIRKLEDLISVIIIIFMSGAVKFQNNNRFYSVILPVVLLTIYFGKKGTYFKYDTAFEFLVLLVGWLFFSTLMHFLIFGQSVFPIGDMMKILSGYIMIRTMSDVNKFIAYYNKIILFLAVMSLIVWGMLNVDVDFARKFGVIHDYAYSRYYDMYIYAVPYNTVAGGGTARNNSIFWEPGAYQLFLNVSIFFDLIYCKKMVNLAIIIKILALLTTFSTTGYIILGLIIVLKYLDLKGIGEKLLLFAAGIIMFFGIFWRNFLDKFSTTGDSYMSYSRRSFDIISDLKVWCNSPFSFLIGVGMKEYKNRFGVLFSDWLGSHIMISGASSNGLTSLLSMYGIMGFMIIIFFYTHCMYKFRNDIDVKVIFVVLMIFVISVATENFLFSPLLISLAMYLNQYKRTDRIRYYINKRRKG